MPIVEFVDDSKFDQLDVPQLLELAAATPDHSIAFLVDGETLSAPDHPILAVGNAGWDDYAEYAGPDAVIALNTNLRIPLYFFSGTGEIWTGF